LYALSNVRFDDIAAKQAVPMLTVSELGRLVLPRPQISQQIRIAEILSTVDEAIEQTEALIAKTRQIKAGLSPDLFSRGLTSAGNLRPTPTKAPNLYRETQLGWIPKEWDCLTFERLLTDAVVAEIQDGNHGELHPKRDDFVPEGIPFLMAKDLSPGEI